MLHVNFDSYNSYVTDSIYQWDKNQKLNITGLPLAEAPEIHFANANMERAIVRQSTLKNGTITATIPNSILQAPLHIKAYIGVYEGETYKIIESITIPVIAKPRPSDYSFEDDGGDIYSYNEILHKIAQFEETYGNIDVNALRNYTAWVSKVENTYSKTETLSAETKELAGLNENAVPDDLFKTILPKTANIVCDTYIGTGDDVSNKLTFDFEPKLLFIGDDSSDYAMETFIRGCSKSMSMREGNYARVSVHWNGKTVSWSSENALYQKNVKDRTYWYVAIG